MTIVISLAIQGPLLPGTAAGTLAVVLIAIRGRPAARAVRAVRGSTCSAFRTCRPRARGARAQGR